MNKKTAIAILIVACVGLAVALVIVQTMSNKEQTTNVNTILQLSNQLDTTSANLTDERQVNLELNSDLATNRALATGLSNQLDQTSHQLAGVQSSLQTAQLQITNLNQHISDLELQNQVLDAQANDLSNTISKLNVAITDTQIKLAVSQTNNAYLQTELQKQVAEKQELQHKFNDLNDVRQQVKKLKTDALVARRLEWIHEGLDPNKMQKGGQILIDHQPMTNSTPNRHNFDLNVEIGADGTVQVLTNVPPPPLPNPLQ